jgi:hypothetical protein
LGGGLALLKRHDPNSAYSGLVGQILLGKTEFVSTISDQRSQVFCGSNIH